MIIILPFKTLLKTIRPEDWTPPEHILVFDPGETTGWAYFVNAEFDGAGEIGPDNVQAQSLDIMELLDDLGPQAVICEDYRIYAFKAKSHSWSSMHTSKLIGAIEALCTIRRTPFVLQGASSKQFCTNRKLQSWGYYQKGSPHMNDAIRHGCYWLLFNKEV